MHISRDITVWLEFPFEWTWGQAEVHDQPLLQNKRVGCCLWKITCFHDWRWQLESLQSDLMTVQSQDFMGY